MPLQFGLYEPSYTISYDLKDTRVPKALV